jgi:hypothetical protein
MVDQVGNRLGPRATFRYVDDAGNAYNVRLDESVGEGVGNAKATTGATALRVSGVIPISPRRVYLALQSDTSVRKSVVICDATNTLFTSDGSEEVTINNVTWITTGTRGESRQFIPFEEEPPE